MLSIGLGLTVALLFGVYLGFVSLVGWILPDTISLPWIGEISWIDAAITWASIPLVLLMSVFLMVPVASAFTGLFLDRIADAVEHRHYPNLPEARRVGIVESLVDTVKFLGVIIAVNAVALIAYVIFTPIAPLLFWVVNGVLLGREYAQMVALRRLPPTEARAFRKRHRRTFFLAGVLMVVPLTIPVLGLLVPILGVATFTHLFHLLNRESPVRNT